MTRTYVTCPSCGETVYAEAEGPGPYVLQQHEGCNARHVRPSPFARIAALACDAGWVVIRAGDPIFNSYEAAEAAAVEGMDLDQKVGCHLVWESPVFARTEIAQRARDRWTVIRDENGEELP